MGSPWLTVLMPAYNEEAGLEESVLLVMERLRQFQFPSEILIVDDASTDRTAKIADALAGRYGQAEPVAARVQHHLVNQGIGAGLRTGVAQARGEWLILIPADLALDLAELSKFVDAASSADVVVGVRSDRRDYTLFRRLVSWVNIQMVRSLFHMQQRQYQYISMYRLAVLRGIEIEYWRSAFFHAEILIKARDLGYRLVEVEVHYTPRASGKATGAKSKLILRTSLDMLRYWRRWLAGHPTGDPGRRAPA